MTRFLQKTFKSRALKSPSIDPFPYSFIHPVASLPSPTSAYVHLPFCAQKCAYCAFPVIISGKTALPNYSSSHPLESHSVYIDLICREISAFFKYYKQTNHVKPLNTLYLGGGTPSLMHPSLLEKVIDIFQSLTGIQKNAEITCEMDPATFTIHTAKQYSHLGVNRASVGAQSFDDNLLAFCNRIHTTKDIYTAIDMLKTAHIDNASIDLISGLPGQTLTTWEHSLDSAIKIAPSHISAYDLTLEADTPFGNKYKSGIHPLPHENEAAQMLTITSNKLSNANFEHYEISNYAKLPTISKSDNKSTPSPFQSRHNMAYWLNQPFYGFGLGATSLVDGYRFARPRKLADYRRYVESIESFTNHEQHPEKDTNYVNHAHAHFYPNMKQQSDQDRLEDFYINSFRLLRDGIVLDNLEEQFGVNAKMKLISAIHKHQYLVTDGCLKVSYRDSSKKEIDKVSLTEKGLLVENSILSNIMAEAVW